MTKYATLAERFVEKTERDPCGCLLWLGATKDIKHHYGRMFVEGKRKAAAHHIAWYLAYGYWPKYLRHTCDTPRCVEVTHLIEGTHAQNMKDMVTRTRSARGKQNASVRLSENDVLDIRWLRGLGVTKATLAKLFSVEWMTVHAIETGRSWAWL